MTENINIDKDKIIFNSTDGKSHLIEYLLEQCGPTKIVIQEFPYELDVEKNTKEIIYTIINT